MRDQLSLPARGATPEEILLRIRRIQSGYEYRVGLSVTYTFGSILSSVVRTVASVTVNHRLARTP